MKRLNITLLCLMLFVCSFAQTNEHAITMVSYEQRWLDNNGTLALKNNTTEDVHNVTFQITYLDMSGNPLDYEDFTRNVEIAPGMTRKLDIPAYEHERWYHYYKSEGAAGGSPSFKIKFELKDYNTIGPDKEDGRLQSDYSLPSYSDSHNRDDEPSAEMILLGLAIILIILGFVVGMYVLVAVMAQKRNRNVVVWILLSIVTTPILMAIILLVIGKENNVKDESYSKMQ